MVRRRMVLQAVPTVLLAGCVEPTKQSSGTSSDTTVATHRTKDIRLKRVVNDGLEDLRIDAEISSEMTAESPAKIEISATNVSDQERDFGFGPIPPFSSIWPENDAAEVSLRFIPASGAMYLDDAGCENVVPDERDDCWRANCKVLINPVKRRKTLAPDEAMSTNYVILEGPDSDTCFPTGTYEATQEYPELDGSCSIEIEVS